MQHVGYRLHGFYRVARLGHLWEMTPKDAQRRLQILKFFDKHGLKTMVDAFGLSRRTLSRWKSPFVRPTATRGRLAVKSSAPKPRRTPNTDPRLMAGIRRLRQNWPNLGKEKLHVLLAPCCKQHSIPLPSVSTIGRIIARAPDKRRFCPSRIDHLGRPKPLRRCFRSRKPQDFKTPPLQLWAVDTVERVRDGMRRYVLTLIDPTSAIAFAAALPGKHARHSAAFA